MFSGTSFFGFLFESMGFNSDLNSFFITQICSLFVSLSELEFVFFIRLNGIGLYYVG